MAATGTAPHTTTTVLAVPVCAKRFHRHCLVAGNRHYSTGSTEGIFAVVCFPLRLSGSFLFCRVPLPGDVITTVATNPCGLVDVAWLVTYPLARWLGGKSFFFLQFSRA